MINVLFNIALLLAMSVFFATYPFKNLKKITSHRILSGLVIGVIGILVMLSPFVLLEGVVFDSRTILLVVSGMIFGWLPTSIASLCMASYRLYLGGTGVFPGLATIISSASIGILWHHKRYKSVLEEKQGLGIEFYLVGVVTHIVMLLCMLLMPASLRMQVISSMSFPILVFYPLGTYLLSLLLFGQAHRIQAIANLEKSERLFKMMFEQAPIGMSLTDLKTGAIENVNHSYLAMLGYSKEELMSRSWADITHPEDISKSRSITDAMAQGNPGPFNFDKRFIRKDGTVLWANLSLSEFTTSDMGKDESLCMTVDITDRKMYEQKILFASNHDALTGLYNRVHFEAYVRDLRLDEHQAVTVAFGDVNGLRILNEAFGREEGDRLLRRIAQIMLKSLRREDYVSRVGGDEFALILFDRTEEEISSLLSSLMAEISSMEMMGSVKPTISFGVSPLSREKDNINEAIKRAEKDVATRKLVDSPQLRGQAVYAIINTLHEKNKREESHSVRVSELCEKLAKAYGMGTMAAAEMRLVGLLHDIGKIAIHESILNKEGKLSTDEWKEMQRHAEIGYRILNSVEDMASLAHYVLAHHERFDGKGYPKGLKAEAIPLQARIITIVDAYDAMTAPRTYREVVSMQDAAREIKRCSGKQFDPDLARLFVLEVLGLSWDEL